MKEAHACFLRRQIGICVATRMHPRLHTFCQFHVLINYLSSQFGNAATLVENAMLAFGGLAQRLDISRAQAKEITTAYFARFPSVRAYIERNLEQGRRDGYVATILGRRRYMPALTSSNFAVRSAAEREATNAPLQGSAADLMKLAMAKETFGNVGLCAASETRILR